MDPLVTPLLFLVLGNLARDLITDACKDYLKDKLKSTFKWLEKLGEGDKVELAYRDAMEQAFSACLEMLLSNIKGYGYSDDELKHYQSSIKSFIKDKKVAEELLNAIREPGRNDLPSADVLRERWKAVGSEELPSDSLWNTVVIAFRRQATKRLILSNELRELLNAQNLQQLKELIERQGGVKVQVRRDKYSQRMRSKFSPVDLANLMPAYADDPGRMVIRDVFVPQNVRENPPPVEIPKDVAQRISKAARQGQEGVTQEDLDERQLEKLRLTYVNQSARPVLDVIAATGNRLLVLTGDPGSGKSTLMRYLLTGIIEGRIDRQTRQPLLWTQSFKDAFPLLIELRDFYALRRRNECDSFLEYVAFMGKTDQWFLDDHAVHDLLENGPSLVMFDGLDEIFEAGDRDRVMHEIAGFAQRYARAKIVVTSRPVGYKEQILREAGFTHFGIQDLDDDQIKTFIGGWFDLTFPQQPQHATQRIERVLGSMQKSKPIRLLAGNPMLLTIMALLAREEELPRERAKFYEKAVEVLCHHWDANRNLDLPEDRYLNADDKKALLRRIAMQMQAGDVGLKGNVIHEDDLVLEIQDYLTEEQWQPNAAEAKKAARRMIQQLRERNYILCLRGPSLYGFVHRTFLEYLTAAEYVRRFDRQPQQMTLDELVALFDEHCRDEEWHEVLRLICGQIDEQFVSKIIEHLATRTDMETWDGETPLPELPLAIWCLGEIRNVAKLDQTGDILLATVVSLFQTNEEVTLDESFFQEITDSANALTVPWPGRRIMPSASGFPSDVDWHYSFWPKVVAAVSRDREITSGLAMAKQSILRQAAIEVLSEKWPDKTTRALLTQYALTDPNDEVRSSGLLGLIDKWPDETTRTFLVQRAINDPDSIPRSVALRGLADNWPTETSRTLLTERAVEDEDILPRRTALEKLAGKWADETTRLLLTERAVQEKADSYLRALMFRWLADNWPDESTRVFLAERAVQDLDDYSRGEALMALGSRWSDEATHALLIERAEQDPSGYARSEALSAMSNHRRTAAAHTFFTERAVLDLYSHCRGTALQILANQWKDDATRRLLTERCVEDPNAHCRRIAVRSLADHWPEEPTRVLLTDRAIHDADQHLRNTALQTLTERWPGAVTDDLLNRRIKMDGFAASQFASQHSEFGRIVFTEDLDGVAPYLDPQLPIEDDHIDEAAEEAQLPPENIDDMVRELSAHLGWDILKGSKG